MPEDDNQQIEPYTNNALLPYEQLNNNMNNEDLNNNNIQSPNEENQQSATNHRDQLSFQFNFTIWSFADIVCDVCRKLCYKKQTCTTYITDANKEMFPEDMWELDDIITCFRCANLIKKSKVPTQAYWNAMFLDDIPEVIQNLSDMEERLLSRIIPFVKIVKLGGRFGQSGFRGQAVLFAQDLEEISEQLLTNLH